MQPKRRKFKKEFRGNMRGISWRGSEISYGEYAIQALDRGWLTANQLESARKAIVRHTKRKGRIWIKVFAHKPVTKKSDEVTRGVGKGDVSHYVAVVTPGRVLMEISGVPEITAMESLALALRKLPIKTRIIKKEHAS